MKIDRLTEATTQKSLVSQPALAQHVVVRVRADIYAPVQLVAPGAEETTKEEYKTIPKVMSFLKLTSNEFHQMNKRRETPFHTFLFRKRETGGH